MLFLTAITQGWMQSTPPAAGSIYLPLWLFNSLGLPVLAPQHGGHWANPSLLGWLLIGIFWVPIWWGVAWLALQTMRKRS